MADSTEVMVAFAKKVGGLAGGLTWTHERFYWERVIEGDQEDEFGPAVITETSGTHDWTKQFTFVSRVKDWGDSGDTEHVLKMEMYNGSDIGLTYEYESGSYAWWYYGDAFTLIYNITFREFPVPE